MCAKRSNDQQNSAELARLDPMGICVIQVRQRGAPIPLHACDSEVRFKRGHSSFRGVEKKAARTRADHGSVALRNVAQRAASLGLDPRICSVSAQRLQDGLNGASI
jgi:hypothetical protein